MPSFVLEALPSARGAIVRRSALVVPHCHVTAHFFIFHQVITMEALKRSCLVNNALPVQSGSRRYPADLRSLLHHQARLELKRAAYALTVTLLCVTRDARRRDITRNNC
jgi:hypothetical protein